MTTTPFSSNRRAWLGVAALMLPCMLVVTDLTVLFLAVPSLKASMHPSSTQLLWITDAYGFLIAGALIVMGTLGDQYGRRKVLMYGSAAFGGASVLAACSVNPDMLIIARGLQGLAGATLIPSTMGLLFGMFPDEGERMKAIGLISFCFTGGAALGPILGGVLLDAFGWHAVFLLNVPAMLAVLIVVPRFVPEIANPSAPRVDIRSAVVIVPRLATRFAEWRLMAAGAVIMAGGLGLLTTVGRHTAPLTVSLIVLIFQAGVAPIVTLGMNLILSSAPPESTSAASGTAQTSNELGGAMGIALLGSLGAAQGNLVSGLTLVAGVGALIMLVVAGLIWRLLRTPPAVAPVGAAPVAEPVCA